MSPRRGPRRSLLGAPPEPFWRPLGPTRGLPKPAKTTKTIEKPSFFHTFGGLQNDPSWGLLGRSWVASWDAPWGPPGGSGIILWALLGPSLGSPGRPFGAPVGRPRGPQEEPFLSLEKVSKSWVFQWFWLF